MRHDYHIYLINRPGRLFNFGPMTIGAYYFQHTRVFLEKQGITSLVRFNKTEQSAKSNINNTKDH